ncbi:MAG: LiaF transmembrane domain-containing protein [Sarcina sp.]
MKKRSVFWGILLIIASILLVVTDLKGFDLKSGTDIVITIILVGILIESIVQMNFFGVIFPIAFIYIIYGKSLHLHRLNTIVVLLAALLLSVGLSIIFKREGYKKMFTHKEKIDLDGDYDVESKTRFGGTVTYVTDKFRSGYLECSLGGVQMYFDRDSIKEGEAILEIKASCSGIELYVPREWRVINGMNNIFSGADEQGKNNINEQSPTLKLKGKLSLSGLTIKYI